MELTSFEIVTSFPINLGEKVCQAIALGCVLFITLVKESTNNVHIVLNSSRGRVSIDLFTDPNYVSKLWNDFGSETHSELKQLCTYLISSYTESVFTESEVKGY
jgi:hypothetical protein